MLSKFQGIRNDKIIAVFDAYRVQRHHEEAFDYDNIHVVFTRRLRPQTNILKGSPMTIRTSTISPLPRRMACRRL